MSISEFTFNPKGEAIHVKIDYRSPHVFSYVLQLIEVDHETVVGEWAGSNQRPEVDEYELPTPPSVNKGRMLECTVTIVDPGGSSSQFRVAMVVSQKCRTTLNVLADGSISGESAVRSLFAALIQDQASRE